MSARVLVVDDIKANRRLLQAKLNHEYFQVSTASNGQEAIERTIAEEPDLILMDIMMPGMDGFEACRKIKTDPRTEHIPIVMVTALGDREDRLRGLSAGADDFLAKPIEDFALLSRVRALTRYKMVADELRKREASGRRIGVIEGKNTGNIFKQARIFIADDEPAQSKFLMRALAEEHHPISFLDTGGLQKMREISVDLMILSLNTSSFDALRLCAYFRSTEATRNMPILIISDTDSELKAVKALDLGASDVIMRPVDTEELSVRIRTQLRRKHYMDALRMRLDQSMELAVTDQLTGLHNRRYMFNQLTQLIQRAEHGKEDFTLLIADIDHFKHVNDCHGHDAGDEVLLEFSKRLERNVRPTDITCRQGGEEFVVMMPNTIDSVGVSIAERIRGNVAKEPFIISQGQQQLNMTISIGVASHKAGNNMESLLKQADEALYKAKSEGRNRVYVA